MRRKAVLVEKDGCIGAKGLLVDLCGGGYALKLADSQQYAMLISGCSEAIVPWKAKEVASSHGFVLFLEGDDGYEYFLPPACPVESEGI